MDPLVATNVDASRRGVARHSEAAQLPQPRRRGRGNGRPGRVAKERYLAIRGKGEGVSVCPKTTSHGLITDFLRPRDGK